MSENKQYTLDEVTAFLCGEAPLDGFWFGDERPIDRLPFWWRKHLRAAVLSASAGEKKDAGWMPIETAPKDGSLIILGSESGVWIAKFNQYFFDNFGKYHQWQPMLLNHDHMPKYERSVESHWMPLPPAPASKSNQEQSTNKDEK